MSYRIAGIDVHKKMLAVVVADLEVRGEYQFERVRFTTNPQQLRLLALWLLDHGVEEVVSNPRRNIGNPSGEHWNGTGNQAAKSEQVQAPCRERSI
jgi:hypothetical protein